jgi:uncharacterized protein VirK/YbjX
VYLNVISYRAIWSEDGATIRRRYWKTLPFSKFSANTTNAPRSARKRARRSTEYLIVSEVSASGLRNWLAEPTKPVLES